MQLNLYGSESGRGGGEKKHYIKTGSFFQKPTLGMNINSSKRSGAMETS